ncbi:MAG: glycerol-3-phosphate dehydrogenase [Paenibacillaceae bacterium]|jgi:glycerol-3-phosphate dehydrogenase|nr:glycerol-3-phosphate dehydrogenase [Paenibacillaceae bacterium]
MNRALSASSRPELIHDLEAGTFDLIIIGGGITGAGIAWDAAKRGLRAVLIEQGDFASGTSSRSTKLIHGGLRYLKKGEVSLVKEVGREREWLYGSAPHLLTPAPMLLPLYKGGTFGYWSASIGLAVYDRLAGVLKQERRVMLRAGRAAKQEPLLKGEGLKGAGLYYEYRSDDARLTMEVLKTANRHGALAINYMQAVDFLYYKSKVCGVTAIDRLTGMEVEIRAKKVVNAAGPWVDLVRAKDHAIRGKTLLLTKGIHLVVSHSKLPVKQSAYFDAPDGRMIFVIPRGKKTYIGTTDTVFTGDPNLVRVTESDQEYLLKAVTEIFPRVKLTANDVESMWAGLRPLIHQEGKKPSDISRKDEIWESPSGLITIAGGKLTGFRVMAEKTVDTITDRIASESRQTFAPCTTDREVISGGDCGRCETYEELREQLLEHGVKRGLTAKAVNELLDRYGSNLPKIYTRLAELDAGFRTWKSEPLAAKRSPRIDYGRHSEAGRTGEGSRSRRMQENAAQAVVPDSAKRHAAAELREEGSGRSPAAAEERNPTAPGWEKEKEKLPQAGAGMLRKDEGAVRSSATGGPSAGRKPATPENGKMSAGERAAWIEEWNRREQQAAAASNAEERARWIREWNQRKRLAGEDELGLSGGSAAELVEAEGGAAGAGAAPESPEVIAEWERQNPSEAAPVRSEAVSGYVEDAWRQLEELTGQLHHEEPQRQGGISARDEGYERAAAEPQGRDAGEGLRRRSQPEVSEEWSGTDGDAPWSASGADAEWQLSEADVRRDGAYGAAEEDGAYRAAEEAGVTPADEGWEDEAQSGWPNPAADLADGSGAASGLGGEEFYYRNDAVEPEAGDVTEADGYFNSLEYKLLKAEVHYCVEEEMAAQASDFLIRRTGLLYFDRERAEEIAIDVIEIMAELLNWSDREVVNQKLQLAKEWELATTAFKWEQD